jgi:predicted TIM-barrel fold metal-dependent hydrolase
MTAVANGASGSGTGARADERLCIVSSDTHIGPTMEQLRPYCPARLLDDFDAFFRQADEQAHAPTAGNTQSKEHRERMLTQVASSGENDPHHRLRDMDADGIAGEVIFHGSQNLNPLPFGFGGRGDRALEVEGIWIYNRWLADFCSVEPARHRGLAQLPGWDPEECVRVTEWAHEKGLGGINLPTLRLEDESRPVYTEPVWEPLWSVCESLDFPMVNHGAADLNIYRDIGPGRYALVLADGPWLMRRVTWWLLFGGVFERHPQLKFVITEQPGDWPRTEVAYLQTVYDSGAQAPLREVMKRTPTEVFATNIYVGASFMSNREAKMFVELGMDDRALWGSDYPHIEGTWPRTLTSLQATFEGVEPRYIRKMLSENAAAAYNFDLEELGKVSARIGPTLGEVQETSEGPPADNPYTLGFRHSGAWS